MSSEIPATPTPAAEPSKEATPPGQAEPAKPDAKPEGFVERQTLPADQRPPEDWRYAFASSQRNVERLHRRNESLMEQNKTLFGTVESMKTDLDEILKRQMPEEEFKALEVQRAAQQERAAAAAATGNMHALVVAQTAIFMDVLKAAGISRDDPAIDWAVDAGNVREWSERVGPSIAARVQRANEERITAHEAKLKAKSQEEVQAEAKALAERTVRAAGVDKIDTARGGRAPASFADKLRALDRNTPEGEAEYQRIRKEVHRGTLVV